MTRACALAFLLILAGAGLELSRFGASTASTAAHLEREVRATVDDHARQLRELAERVARETGATVAAAPANPDEKSALFDYLTRLAHAPSSGAIALTVYSRTELASQYSVLAWSDGPAEDVVLERLGGGAALFLARGTLGLRLVYVQPIELKSARVGVVAAEVLLSPAVGVGPASNTYHLETSFGRVTATTTFPGASSSADRPSSFVIAMPSRGPVLEVRYATADLQAARVRLRQETAAVAALPLLAMLLVFTARATRRRTESSLPWHFTRWTAAAMLLMLTAAATSIELARLIGAPDTAADALEGLAALGFVALVPSSLRWWWRRPSGRRARLAPLRFGLEQLAAGLAMAALLALVAQLLHGRIIATTLRQWQWPLFPLEWNGLLFLTGLLLAEVAIYWAVATILALAAHRWGIVARRPRVAAVAGGLWLVPTIVFAALPNPWLPVPLIPLMIAAATAVLFAAFATSLRRRYRQTTQAMRLVLLFAALFAPVAILYPWAWSYADTVARSQIEQHYAPDTIARPQQVRDALNLAKDEIDQIPVEQLSELISTPAPSDAAGAFNVWSQTSLLHTRSTSSLELYAPNHTLVSRFALNVPHYGGGTDVASRSRTVTCNHWDVFGEAVRFGAEERDMLHAAREICDAAGEWLGAIVVHVINDYQALPFISSPNPYNDLLRSPDTAPQSSALGDLQVVVYGWSFSPLFTSGNIAWPITPDLFSRLYQSRTAFWTRLPVEDRTYNVYFANDQRFIYALGYPTTSFVQHLTRLAEMATLMALIFIVLLVGATAAAPLAYRGGPLASLFMEIRTSYYRKLFLYFVLAAIAPVLLFAFAFEAYMTDKFRADVEHEAASVATVARRVLEQTLVNFEPHSGQIGTVLSDEVLVWIGQALHQDVNLFEGSILKATSQRDLFVSGLLPTRTPAAVYRAIALERLPTSVTEDNLGTFHYLVAAAPLPAAGGDWVLSVPLALRQREIEREIDDLNRGVLVGAVFVILFAAGLAASVASRVSDPVARLSRATRQIAAGKLDVRLVADTSDELSRLIADFNTMAATLSAQRTELARTNQLKAWADMARQVAHEIKNPLTPIQLAAEHLLRVHDDQGRPLGQPFDHCVTTILGQVRLLRKIAGEFSNYAADPTPRLSDVSPTTLVEEIIAPYRAGGRRSTSIENALPASMPAMRVDRTLVARALTNIVENALQAMPAGGVLRITGATLESAVQLTFTDTGVGMDDEAVRRAFEPYFSTKTAGSGLGLPNAKRNLELCGGSIAITSAPERGTTVVVTLPRAGSGDEPGAATMPSQ